MGINNYKDLTFTSDNINYVFFNHSDWPFQINLRAQNIIDKAWLKTNIKLTYP